MEMYIGLLRPDGTEPDKASGYCRVRVDAEAGAPFRALWEGQQIVFPDVTAPGYGRISAAVLYDQEEDGKPLCFWKFPDTVDVHQGVVPVIHKGRLWRGVETQVRVNVKPSAAFSAGGLRG